jgi:hypothetical protein
MSGELIASLVVLLHLLLVDGTNLSELFRVVAVLDGCGVRTGGCLSLVGA